MHRGLAAVCLVVLLVGTAVASAPGASPHAPVEQASEPPGPTQTTPDGFDSTVFDITVYENGSARWSLQYVRRLDNASEEETFQAFAAGFESGDSELAQNFRTRAERLTNFGTNATGREMTATAFDRRAYTEPSLGGARSRGVVELSFRWTNFARPVGDRLIVDDVFDGGLYVGPDQRLEFRHGPGLTFADAGPTPDAGTEGGDLSESNVLTYFGERTFADSRPRITYASADTGSSTGGGDGGSGDTGDGADSGDSSDGGDDGPPAPALAIVGLLLVIGVVGGIAWYAGALRKGPQSDGTAGGAETATADAGASTPAAPAEAEGPEAAAVSGEELVSDEERVLGLLEDNGGRMKQVDIVDSTDWSKSKVSMLLSEMEENDQISKLRVGRENIISLAGEEPEAAGSPFDEE